jgi:hypothetical protein
VPVIGPPHGAQEAILCDETGHDQSGTVGVDGAPQAEKLVRYRLLRYDHQRRAKGIDLVDRSVFIGPFLECEPGVGLWDVEDIAYDRPIYLSSA